MLTRPSGFSWFLAPAVVLLLLLSAASAEVAGGANWTPIDTSTNKLDDGTSITSTLYVESPVMRSADNSLTVVHFRVSFVPALKGLNPGDETRTIESVQVFDCQNHEYWSVYTIGLPSPGLRNTAHGSGQWREIMVHNFDSAAVRQTDWAGVTVAAFACKQ
jgi:hypothetical protein